MKSLNNQCLETHMHIWTFSFSRNIYDNFVYYFVMNIYNSICFAIKKFRVTCHKIFKLHSQGVMTYEVMRFKETNTSGTSKILMIAHLNKSFLLSSKWQTSKFMRQKMIQSFSWFVIYRKGVPFVVATTSLDLCSLRHIYLIILGIQRHEALHPETWTHNSTTELRQLR